MKIKQKLLIASALSCAAVAAIGYIAKINKEEEVKTELLPESNDINNETDTNE